MASACCLAIVRLLRLGQSMLATVDTQAARNSRGAGGGMLGSTGCAAGGVPGWRGAAPGVPGVGAVGVLEQASSSAGHNARHAGRQGQPLLRIEFTKHQNHSPIQLSTVL